MSTAPKLELVSHHLCPYVQRAAITLAEKGVPFKRTYVDLADKPAWFAAISPLGKVPLLKVEEGGRTHVLFESAVICEYLDDTVAPRLHPEDPIARAQHRAWVEFASAILNDIGGYYAAPDVASFGRKAGDLRAKFSQLDRVLDPAGPYFAGARFSLVDAAFGPVFRYFDVFETFLLPGVLDHLPRVRAWRAALAGRPSVRAAVGADYPVRLDAFLRRRGSDLSSLMPAAKAA
jgi:glutathione S-transferase